MLYVVASMEPELDNLQRELEAQGESSAVGFPMECHFVGVGPRRSGQAMVDALAQGGRRPEGVLMLGVAGAVDPEMETGEVILAESYALDSEEDSAEVILPDAGMLAMAELAAAEARMPVSRSGSLTVDHLISNGLERRQLRERYGVGSVNMEDHAVAAAARDAGVPFLSVRVILDTARQTIPGYLPGLSRSRHAMFTDVVMRPWRIPTLLRLKSQMELCQSVITRFGMSYFQLEAQRRKRARGKAESEAIY